MTDWSAVIDRGMREAAAATTSQDEFSAWDRVIAQHIDVFTDSWRPPRGLLRALGRRIDCGGRKPMDAARGTSD